MISAGTECLPSNYWTLGEAGIRTALAVFLCRIALCTKCA